MNFQCAGSASLLKSSCFLISIAFWFHLFFSFRFVCIVFVFSRVKVPVCIFFWCCECKSQQIISKNNQWRLMWIHSYLTLIFFYMFWIVCTVHAYPHRWIMPVSKITKKESHHQKKIPPLVYIFRRNMNVSRNIKIVFLFWIFVYTHELYMKMCIYFLCFIVWSVNTYVYIHFSFLNLLYTHRRNMKVSKITKSSSSSSCER